MHQQNISFQGVVRKKCENLCSKVIGVVCVPKTLYMDGWMDGWMGGWTDMWMDGCTNGRMDGRTDG